MRYSYPRFHVLLVCLSVVLACSSVSSLAEPELHDLSSGLNNRDITFSADGNLILTTIMSPKNLFAVIAMSRREAGGWSDLEVAPFSGEYQDIEAMFSPDGTMVYFASKRPKPGREGDDWDLWRVAYDGKSFGEPEHLGDAVNSRGNEFYPSVASNGNLYFTATREDGVGSEDIFLATLDGDGSYSNVTVLGDGVNTTTNEFNAFVAPDESYLVFGSQRRPDEIGGGDLYISWREDDQFGPAQLLPGAGINTSRLDYCPYVFKDRFYFTSERATAIPAGNKSIQTIEALFTQPGNGLGDLYSLPVAEALGAPPKSGGMSHP